MRKGGWPATERRSGLAFSYRRWLTVEPSRKPTSKAKGRHRCAYGRTAVWWLSYVGETARRAGVGEPIAEAWLLLCNGLRRAIVP